jgi:Arc/MetJ-type ribon-helix-helix transcriptional regulator
MPMNEKRTVELSKAQAGALRRAVASSTYIDTDEIMAEALNDWFAKRDAMASDIELLRRLYNGSAARGEVCPVDFTGLRKASHQQLRSA